MVWAFIALLVSVLFTLVLSGVVLHTVRMEMSGGSDSELLRRIRDAETKTSNLMDVIIQQELRIEALAGKPDARRMQYFSTAPRYEYEPMSLTEVPRPGGPDRDSQ